ncbi:BamA/TamA family outer membrane protein [Chlorobium sp. N1]|uniref:BamA/TamA family outer membrane protein n=1 Tax=Chlorobium sp. N1 TaxID=2491138 RepID=UPI00103B39E4|nr:BamA/TamA family outer membrane protein [Chlorobium sp. N1]TCD48773.1 sorting and assembly machinery component 50 [Chlorobium sp. N1]
MTLLMLASVPERLHAEAAASAKTPPENTPYVGDVRFIGNRAVTDRELLQVIMTAPRKSLFGLGIFAKNRQPFNEENFEKDLTLLRKLYTYKGYFFADLDPHLTEKNGGKRIDIDISIRENEPTRIDTLSYLGLETAPDSLRRTYLEGALLETGAIFSVEKLINERDRSLAFFREHGYAFFNEDSLRIRVDTVGTRAGVQMMLHLPRRLHYGGVAAVVHNPLQRKSTKAPGEFEQDSLSVRIAGGQKVLPVLITSAIDFRPGMLTRQSREQKTLENFGSTGIFSSIYIQQDSVRDGRLYSTVHLEPAPKHQIEPKILADNRYGSLFLGGALAYENRNLFGGAEQLRTSTEYGSQLGSSNSLLANIPESDYDPVVPYELRLKNTLLLPVLRKPGNYYSASAEYSRSRQPVLLTSTNALVRGSYSAATGKKGRIDFDFFDIEWVQKDSLRGFGTLFRTELAENIGIDHTDEAAVSAGLDSLLDAHVNQTFRLRYSRSNRDPLRPMKTIWKTDLLLEQAGAIPWLVDEYIDRKSYSGFADSDPQIFGTTYSQYVKADTRVTFDRPLTSKSRLAGKLDVGWMAPYGKAETTPEERRFYAGGSNSMRGWLFNTLGPGSSSSEAAANFGADVKVELAMEYRLKFFRLFGQESGVTFFTDAGNIWNRKGPYAFSLDSLTRDFAWDLGLGLRIGSPIGPFRFDFAWKLHDPAAPDPWLLGAGGATFNFGIGEAF